jgi:PilZ domain
MFEWIRSFWRRLTGCTAAPARQPKTERRVWVRYPAAVATHCDTNGPGTPPLAVHIRDVSPQGISLQLGRQLKPGDLVNIDLPGRDGRRPTRVLAYVKHATAQASGGWVVGCVFAAELDEADLGAFGVRRVEPAGPDKRRWNRSRPARGEATIETVSGSVRAPGRVQILNLSPVGIGLALDARLEPGTLLGLHLRSDPAHSGVTILASVVYLSPCGQGEWVVGCTFIRELSESDLAQLRRS